MFKDYYNGSKWTKVDAEWLEGINNVKNITEIFEAGNDRIKVVYNSGKEVYYQNIHGSWGFPTIIK